jgi:hypothetical protein
MAATGDGSGRNDKRTGGARPPTIELTATEVPVTGPAGPRETAKDPAAGAHPAEATVSPPTATSGTTPKPDGAPGAGAATGQPAPAQPPSMMGPAGATTGGKPTDTTASPAAEGAEHATASHAKPHSHGAAHTKAADAKSSPGSSAPSDAKSASDTKATDVKATDTKATGDTKTGHDLKSTAGTSGSKPAASPATAAGMKASGTAGSSSAATEARSAAGSSAPAPRRGVGVGGLIAAALIGGVVGLGGALAVTHYGIVPLPRTTDAGAAELAARVDALSAAVSAAPASDPDAASALRAAVSELGTRVDALAAAAVPPTEEANLSARLSALEEQVSTAVPGAGSADASVLQASVAALGDRLDGLAGEVEKLAAAPAAAPADAADAGALAALDDRVGALDTQLGERIAGVDRTAGEQLAALDDRLGGRLDALDQQLAAIGERLTVLSEAREQAASTITALGDRLGTLEAVDPVEAARGPAAITFATLRLGEALDSGRPYAAELAALTPRLGGSEDVSALSATAESGVPTRATLAALLVLEKPAMLAATAAPAPAPADAGPLDALLSGAQSLVSIRPTSAESGDPVATQIEAVTAALAAGDLAAAETAFAALPETVRAAAPRFAQGLAQRRTAEAAFAGLEATVLARLNGATE